MIFEILHILKEELNHFLNPIGSVKPIELENVAILDSADNADRETDLVNKVAMTLINIQEESTLKNFPNHKIEAGELKYKNPKVYLNLHILFSANRTTYKDSLQLLSRIIAFFQGKRVFTQADTMAFKSDPSEDIDVSDFRFIVELHTPSFEELNYIWGTLGGRQLPSAMYKVCVLELERDLIKGGGGLIQEVQGDLAHIKN